MTTDEIKILFESYYSGDISPDDYETLLSVMKEAKDLPPELEKECRILLKVDSYAPTMPEGFERKLSEAIDNRYRKSNNTLRTILSAAAAVAVLIGVAIGMFNWGNNGLSAPEHISGSGIAQEAVQQPALRPMETVQGNELTSESVETKSAEKTVSSEINGEPAAEINDEELVKAERIVDESLLNVLSMIQVARNEVVESLDDIQPNK
ncbi:hypothetical protein [uncultured Duncaniella sp.]|jgi:hypothetical protein|uniref:hypothetical protein n=1 Tax=uncultured Duncaniella sp. TaxID=2768039 RepID=UPI002674E645|nr:hypothetical protein [uncultured Duncaniella sp.]